MELDQPSPEEQPSPLAAMCAAGDIPSAAAGLLALPPGPGLHDAVLQLLRSEASGAASAVIGALCDLRPEEEALAAVQALNSFGNK